MRRRERFWFPFSVACPSFFGVSVFIESQALHLPIASLEKAKFLDPGAPVVLGGMGGSGTRLAAEIVERLGFYLGSDRNAEKDNLWFTLLFKRLRWLQKIERSDPRQIEVGLRAFTKAMLGQGVFSLAEMELIFRSAAEMTVFGQNAFCVGRGIWPWLRVQSMLAAAEALPIENVRHFHGWGWKESNSHIYIEHLLRHFPAMKYIHVLRHGVDMAFSPNQNQLFTWGPLFCVSAPRGDHTKWPAAALKYWVRSNLRALEIGHRAGSDRFLCLNYDRLCAEPTNEIRRLVEFIGVDLSQKDFLALCALPRRLDSHGRYLQRDCRVFDCEDIDAVREMGFDVKI